MKEYYVSVGIIDKLEGPKRLNFKFELVFQKQLCG